MRGQEIQSEADQEKTENRKGAEESDQIGEIRRNNGNVGKSDEGVERGK